MATTTATATAARDFEAPRRPYVAVFIALAAITVVELQVPTLPVGKLEQVLLLMATAAGKAALVVLYYMHLRYEPRLLALVPLVPLGLVFILVAVLAL